MRIFEQFHKNISWITVNFDYFLVFNNKLIFEDTEITKRKYL
jgi:hypothetical protein